MINKLLADLKNASKTKKFSLLDKIIQYCLKNYKDDIFLYFDQQKSSFQEYLDFDPNPEKEIKNAFSSSLLSLFRFIQKISDLSKFRQYFPVYERYQDYVSDIVIKAQIFQCFGYLYWLSQDLANSHTCLQQSLDLITESGKVNLIPGRYTNIGYLYEFEGKFDRAEEYYLKGMDFARENNYQEAMKMAFAALGRLHMRRQNYPLAQQYFQETLALYDENSHDHNRIAVLINLATSFMFQKKHKTADDKFNQALTDWLKDENPELFYSVLVNQAANQISMHEYSQAEQNLLTALKFAENNSNVEQQFGCYLNLGDIYFQKNTLHKSEKYYLKALQIAKNTQNQNQIKDTATKMAVLYIKLTDYTSALDYILQAEKIAKKVNDSAVLIKLAKCKADCYEFQKKYKEALSALKKYIFSKEKREQLLKKKEQNLSQNKPVSSGRAKQFVFKKGYSLISQELSSQIGIPIIGNSDIMQKTIQKAFMIAANSQASVLIRGESGTGKELIARLIHFSSNRHSAPFIAINSASFTSGLVQSALFGHEKGAFTGAVNKHIGYFQSAHQGTIFLDEITELTPEIQAKLLRVIEDKSLIPLGSSKKIDIDFRLISATNQDIYKFVEENKFRLDLLNRINTLEVNIPPLRKRRDDIPLLIDFFLTQICEQLNRKRPAISSAAINRLCLYDYPGNVRQLHNIIEKLIIFCQNDLISEDNLFFLEAPQENLPASPQNLNLAQNEKKLIELALQKANNVKSEAAKLLGISPYALHRRLKKLL